MELPGLGAEAARGVARWTDYRALDLSWEALTQLRRFARAELPALVPVAGHAMVTALALAVATHGLPGKRSRVQFLLK